MENQNSENINDQKENLEQKGKEVLENVEEGLNKATEKAKEIIHSENKKVLAGIMAILFGWAGIHKFILGYTNEGIIQILLNLACGAGGIIGLIEGIIYLTKSDEEFHKAYQQEKRGWF